MKKIYLILAFLLTMLMSCKTPEGQKVLIETSYGNIKVVLYDDTPLHRDNFVKLVNEGYYTDLTFHRVIKNFMIQGGRSSVEKDSILNESELIPAEINPSQHIHKAGALAAARWGNDENPKKMSDQYQFYIVSGKPILDMDFDKLTEERIESLKLEIVQTLDLDQQVKDSLKTEYDTEGYIDWTLMDASIVEKVEKEAENRKDEIVKYTQKQKDLYKELGGAPFLDGEYTVFGEVYEGMDVVRKIERVETNPNNDRPLQAVVIKSIQLIQ